MTDLSELRCVEVELRRIRLSLRRPHRASHGTEDRREVTLVRVRLDDGFEGWGECSALSAPTYTAEYGDGAFEMLRTHLADWVLGVGPAVVGHPMAHAAVRDALLDAGLRRKGARLVDRYGSPLRSVRHCTVVSAPNVDELLETVAACSGPVKVKIWPGHDLEPLRALRSAFPDRWLAADANGSYAATDADRLAAIDELGLSYLEQPSPGVEGNVVWQKSLATPICLDESIGSAEDLRFALSSGALSALNVKPARVGGLDAASALMDLAHEAGIGILVGGMLESGIGRASALVLAMDHRCTLPSDLGPSAQYWDADVTPEIVVDPEDRVVVPVGLGLGMAPLAERLDEFTVERVLLSR